MSKLGFFLDMSRCIGCGTCQVACKAEHHLQSGEFFRRAGLVPVGGELEHVCYSGACNHCSSPGCVAVCPTGAMYVQEDGTVVHRDDLCIGCGRCMYGCPYGAPSLNKRTGYAQKCDACAARRERGEEPVCVAACPTRALKFGPADQFPAAAAPFLPDPAQTQPSLSLQNAPFSQPKKPDTVRCQEKSVEAPPLHRDTEETFLILGSGAAAVAAAKAIRQRNRTASVKLVTRSEHLPYCRPMLSKSLLRGFWLENYTLVDQDWLARERIELIPGRTVTNLDPVRRTVLLADGEALSYDKCIYALGAECFVPPIPGAEQEGVFTLRHSEDLEALRRCLLRAKRAVIIGGGFIGLETAWQLQEAGVSATVLEGAPQLMGRLIDLPSSQLLQRQLEKMGILAVVNAKITQITGSGRAQGVLLENGRHFPADLVILSTGVRANVGPAQAAGLAVNRSVVVNDLMETSVPGIYACGDCAEYQGGNSATWVESVLQGEAAGANASGDTVRCSQKPGPVVVHTAGTALFTAGVTNAPELERVSGFLRQEPFHCFRVNPVENKLGQTFVSLSFLHERLSGAVMVGELSKSPLLQRETVLGTEKAECLRRLEQEGMVFDGE